MAIKVLNISPLGYTGLAYYDYSLCQSLAEHGVNIELCTSDRWILDSYKGDFKITHLYRRCSGNISKIIKGINYVKASVRVYFHVIKNKYDIVHFQIIEFPIIDLLLIAAFKLAGKHVVYTPHDIVHNKAFPLNNKITSFIYSISNYIIAHKKANLDTLVEKFRVDSDKIRIIPHGGYEYFVDRTVSKADARKRLGFRPEDKLLLFFGNIRSGKGLDVLLKAMPLIIRGTQNVRLVIAGRPCGNLSAEWLNQEIKQHGIIDNISAKLSFITDKDTLDYYMACDLVVLPYTTVSESGVLRYAQTCGKPVICSDLDEFKDTIIHGKTGYLFRTGDHMDLAAKIIEILRDINFVNTGAESMQLMNSDYKWSRIASLTKKVYDELTEKRSN